MLRELNAENCVKLAFCAAIPREKNLFRVPGSVRFGYGLGMETVRAVPVFGSGGSSKEGGFFCVSVQFQERTVPVAVPGKRFQRFRFRFRFLEKTVSDGSGFRFRFGSWATLPFAEATAEKSASGSGRRKWPTKIGILFRNHFRLECIL